MTPEELFKRLSPRLQVLYGMLLVGAGYYTTALIALQLAFKPDFISAVWLPNAVLLTALLVTHPRQWPYWLAAAVPAELAADIPNGIAPIVAVKFVLADWIEVLIAATLLRRVLIYKLSFDRMRGLLFYFACAVVAAPFIAAFPGAYLTGSDPMASPYWTRFYRWFLSDALTHLVVTSTFLVWWSSRFQMRSQMKNTRILETTLLLLGLMISSVYTFGGFASNATLHPWMLTLPIPFLLWAAARFGVRWTLTSSFLMTLTAIFTSSKGMGPFTELSPAMNVLNLQIFLMLPLASVITVAAALEERARAEQLVSVSLREKETLLKEVHHRVKNNLQVITGLLDMQSLNISDSSEREVFRDSRNRVLTMALIHEDLYRSPDLAGLDFGDYIQGLLRNLSASMGINAELVNVEIDAQHRELIIDTALPVSLIINELVSNAFKHAFPGGRQGRLRIGFRATGTATYELVVSDDGVGLPADLDIQKLDSLGIKLVRILTEQLGGTLKLEREGGTTFTITFREYHEAGTALY
jgi:two-component sensor histidine kinase/integral membrane sensor domain MASE1